MQNNYSKFIRTIHFIGDLILINAAFIVSYQLKFDEFSKLISDYNYQELLLIFNITWLLSVLILKPYEIYRVSKYEQIVSQLLKLFVIHALLVMAYWVIQKTYFYSREHLITTFLLLVLFVCFWRIGLVYSIKKYRKKGFNYRKVVVIGLGETSKALIDFFKNSPEYGYKLLAVYSDLPNNDDYYKLNGNVDNFLNSNNFKDIDEIYCSLADLSPETIEKITDFADNHLIRVKMLPDVRGLFRRRVKVDFYDDLPILVFRDIPLDNITNRILKRVFDVFFSLFVILFILTWLFPLIALLIKFSSKGPVLFKQVRSGKDNTNFWCWKFRSMHINETADVVQATKNDNRIFAFGAFLRKTSLDELPQFFNVFLGQMSVVGPRPHMLKHTEKYSLIIDKYMVRHFVKPGITGLAQVKGYRGETKDPIMMKNRIMLDKLYIESWSFLLDIRIIIQTIVNGFKNNPNAY